MADPLLNTLCSICHISTPKYTCPGCNSHTCSLACNKKHKSWANCSGKRDPTAYMPASKLKTPAGVDHDYNFLSSIERERERNQREIVDERRLFSEKELGQLDDPYSFRKQWFGENVRFHPVGAAPRQFGSDGEDSDGAGEGGGNNRKHIPAKASQLTRTLRQRLALEGVEVVQMPVGMTRQRENTTSWNRKSRRINWCVEWIVYDGGGEAGEERKKYTRIRHKALETTPLYKALGNSMAWYKKGHQEEDDPADDEEIELAQAGRRNKVLIREVKEDRRRGGGAMQDGETTAWPARAQYPTQNPFTGAWARDAGATSTSWQADEEVEARRRHRFYLLRPLTVAGKPRELIPVEATDGMGAALRGRTVLEFPTIYVLPPASESSSTAEQAPESSSPPLPEGHILGSIERRATGKRQSAASKRKAGPKDDNVRQHSHKRQAVGKAGIPMRPSAAGGGGAQRGRGGAAASARGRGKGRGGRVQSSRQQRGGDQDAEEGEVNSDGDEVMVARPRPSTNPAAAGRADTSSSDPDSSSDEDEDVGGRDGFWASSRPPQGAGMDDDEDDGDDGPPEEEATSAPTPGPTNGTKKPGTGLVDYGSDSEDGSEDDDDGDVDLAALQPENPELVAGAIQEIVGLLS